MRKVLLVAVFLLFIPLVSAWSWGAGVPQNWDGMYCQVESCTSPVNPEDCQAGNWAALISPWCDCQCIVGEYTVCPIVPECNGRQSGDTFCSAGNVYTCQVIDGCVVSQQAQVCAGSEVCESEYDWSGYTVSSRGSCVITGTATTPGSTGQSQACSQESHLGRTKTAGTLGTCSLQTCQSFLNNDPGTTCQDLINQGHPCSQEGAECWGAILGEQSVTLRSTCVETSAQCVAELECETSADCDGNQVCNPDNNECETGSISVSATPPSIGEGESLSVIVTSSHAFEACSYLSSESGPTCTASAWDQRSGSHTYTVNHGAYPPDTYTTTARIVGQPLISDSASWTIEEPTPTGCTQNSDCTNGGTCNVGTGVCNSPSGSFSHSNPVCIIPEDGASCSGSVSFSFSNAQNTRLFYQGQGSPATYINNPSSPRPLSGVQPLASSSWTGLVYLGAGCSGSICASYFAHSSYYAECSPGQEWSNAENRCVDFDGTCTHECEFDEYPQCSGFSSQTCGTDSNGCRVIVSNTCDDGCDAGTGLCDSGVTCPTPTPAACGGAQPFCQANTARTCLYDSDGCFTGYDDDVCPYICASGYGCTSTTYSSFYYYDDGTGRTAFGSPTTITSCESIELLSSCTAMTPGVGQSIGTVTRSPPSSPAVSCSSNVDGIPQLFTCGDVFEGTYTMSCDNGGPSSPSSPITIAPVPSSISGDLRYADGRLADDVSIPVTLREGSVVVDSIDVTDGTYSFTDVDPGLYTVRIEPFGFDISTAEVLVECGSSHTQDLSVVGLVCETSCVSGNGRCNYECLGEAGCSLDYDFFDDYAADELGGEVSGEWLVEQLINRCTGAEPSDRRPIPGYLGHYFVCCGSASIECEGECDPPTPPYTPNPKPPITYIEPTSVMVESDARDLVQFTRLVNYGGFPVRMNVVTISD